MVDPGYSVPVNMCSAAIFAYVAAAAGDKQSVAVATLSHN